MRAAALEREVDAIVATKHPHVTTPHLRQLLRSEMRASFYHFC
jgi:hypothetical protein